MARREPQANSLRGLTRVARFRRTLAPDLEGREPGNDRTHARSACMPASTFATCRRRSGWTPVPPGRGDTSHPNRFASTSLPPNVLIVPSFAASLTHSPAETRCQSVCPSASCGKSRAARSNGSMACGSRSARSTPKAGRSAATCRARSSASTAPTPLLACLLLLPPQLSQASYDGVVNPSSAGDTCPARRPRRNTPPVI